MLRQGEPVAITSKVLTTLAVLIRAQGKAVGREELLSAVWPDSFVEQGSLAQNIFVLRKLLAPDFPDGNPIETLPRVGYRFRVPVDIIPAEERPEFEARITAATNRVPPPSELWAKKRPQDSDEAQDLSESPAETGSDLFVQGAPSGILWQDVSRGETSEQTPPPAPHFHVPNRSRAASIYRVAWVVAGLIFVGVVAGLWRFAHAHSASGAQQTLEIADFRNLSADPAQDWIGVCTAELLKSRLGDANPSPALSPDRSTVALLPARPHAGHNPDRFLLTGAYLIVGNELRIDTQLKLLGSSRAPAFFSVHGDASRLADLTSSIGDELRSQMGLPARGVPGNGAQPSLSPEGARFYAEGLRAFEHLNLPVARVLLERAAQADPGAAVVHLYLAETWAALDNETEAAREADRASALRQMVPEETRLRILATVAAISGQWDEAVRLDLTLTKCWPGEQAFGVDLASALHHAGRDLEAKRILNSLHDLSAEQEMLQQLALCEVDGALGDFQGEADTASKLISESQADREHAPVARAQLYQAEALEQLGQLETALRFFAQSESEADAAGDTATLMRASIGHANLIAKTGGPAAAAGQLQQTLALARHADATSEQVECLLSLGAVYRESKALNLSLAASVQALVLAQRLGRQRDVAAAYLSLGQTEIYLGHAAKAREDLDTALAQVSTSGDAPLKVSTLGALGVLDYMQGDLRSSATLLQQAVQMDNSAGGREVAAHYMGRLSQVLTYQGKNDEANQVLNTWCAYETKTQDLLDLAGCELFRSQADLQAGHAQEAQQEIEKVLAASHDPLVTAEAHRQLALVHLRQGDLAGARNAIETAQIECRGMLNEEDYLLPIGIAAARVEAATGALRSALVHLSILQQRAKDLKLTELELEADYASDQIELSIDPVQAARQLQALATKAETLGFLSFANQADQMIRQQKDTPAGPAESAPKG